MSDKDIATAKVVNLPAATVSPMDMMMQAKAAGFELEEINAMMDLQDRNDKRLAKQAFDKAMADFKRNPPKVIKDQENKQYGSMYATIGNVVNTVNEAMGPFGLNARWEFPPSEGETILCTCILAHELGHEERVTLSAPIDKSGAKNPLQQQRSSRTYLRLETFEAVTGIASQYNQDDDGNASSEPVAVITGNQALKIHSMITENGLDMDAFMQWIATGIKVAVIEDIPADAYSRVTKKINATIKAQQ